MFLRKTPRKKDGKTHDYWSVVENKRVAGGRVVQRHVLYLGEINSSQAAVWRKAIEVLETTRDSRGHWRCSPKIAARASRPIRQSSSFACRTCVSVSRWPRFLVWGSDVARAILTSARGAGCRFGGSGGQRCG